MSDEFEATFTLLPEEKAVVVGFIDRASNPLTTVKMNSDTISKFIGNLVGALARLRGAPDTSPERLASGHAKLPPATLDYQQVMIGKSQPSGTLHIAFEIASGVWLRFALPQNNALGLHKALQKYLSQPQSQPGKPN